MKNKFIIAVFFSAFLLIASNVQAANFTDNQTVDTTKTWTIKFTSDVGFDDLTKQGITVTDSTGATVLGVGLQLGQDSKTVIVTAPEGGYTPGESYILNVGTKTHSSKGNALKNEYKVHFSIKKDSSDSNIVTFKDANLEQVVREVINKPAGDIYKNDVEKITELNAEKKNIKDISGIENLINLQTLNLGFNKNINDISALKGLTNLQDLRLYDNCISDINALKGLVNLDHLNLNINHVCDISALENLTNLRHLFLGSNQISDISGLSGLSKLITLNLQWLNLGNNQISTLKGLVNLQQLFLSGNQISDINVLKELTNLRELYLDNNQINDISTLSGLTNLGILYLNSNQISDYTPVKSYYNKLTEKDFELSGSTNSNDIVTFKDKNLEQAVRDAINKPTGDIYKSDAATITELSVEQSGTQDISGIENLINLQYLNLAFNPITDIGGIEKLVNLQTLNLTYTQISDDNKKLLESQLPNCNIIY